MIRAAIFDLDGTLVDSLPGISAGLNRALAAHGLPAHPAARVKGFVGNGSRMLVRRGIGGEPTDELVEQVHHDFLPAYEESWLEGTHLYPGIREMLEDLHREGLPLAVCSNKPHHYTVEIMTRMFDWVPWTMILGQQNTLPRKPDPSGALQIAERMEVSPPEIAFVGDSLVDFETGRAAGMQTVLVAWGFSPPDTLKEATALLMPSVAALHAFLQVPRQDD